MNILMLLVISSFVLVGCFFIMSIISAQRPTFFLFVFSNKRDYTFKLNLLSFVIYQQINSKCIWVNSGFAGDRDGDDETDVTIMIGL